MPAGGRASLTSHLVTRSDPSRRHLLSHCEPDRGGGGDVTDGRLNPPWSGRRTTQATELVRRQGEALGLPCCICGQPINYRLRWPDPYSCSLQHVKSQRDFPHLRWEPSNWAPSHLDCNTRLGAGDPTDLGVMS